MTRLIFHSGQYQVPDEWNDPDWIMDFKNFPDPMFYHLRNEYDWENKNDKGLLYGYIKHLAGTAYARDIYQPFKLPEKPKREYSGSPHAYFLFAKGATTLINHPSLIRTPYFKCLSGSDVINYVNKVPIKELFPQNWDDYRIFSKLDARKNIISMKYSALYARTFNATSGILNDDVISTKNREPVLAECKICKGIYELTGSATYTMEQNAFSYNHAKKTLEKQKVERVRLENM